jgi:hypothetical protein
MINGPWGSGKTYFAKKNLAEIVGGAVGWTTVVANFFKKVHRYCIDKKAELMRKNPSPPFPTQRKLLYISLFGAKNANDVNVKIINSIYIGLDNNIAKTLGASLSVFTRSGDISMLLKNINVCVNDYVFVFDDLERILTENIGEVFGYINNYTEHRNAKVIILCDESKLETLETYAAIKSKTIRHTYKYHLNEDEFYQTATRLAESLDSNVEDVVKRNSAFIKSLSYNKNENLRTLSQALSNLNYIMDSVGQQEYLDSYSDTMLRVLVGYLTHINSGAAGKENINKLISSGLSWMEIQMKMNNNKQGGSNSDEYFTFANSFFIDFFGDTSKNHLSLAAYDVCINGYCQKEAVKSDYDKYVLCTYPKIDLDHLLVENIWRLSDAELQTAINNVLNKLDKKKYTGIHFMLRDIRSIWRCVKENLIPNISEDKLVGLGTVNISCIKKQNPKEFVMEAISPTEPLARLAEFNEQDGPIPRIVKFTLELADETQTHLSGEKINILWKLFTSGGEDTAYLLLFDPHAELASLPIFAIIYRDNLIDAMYNITPNACFKLISILKNRYTLMNNDRHLAEDSVGLRTLKETIELILNQNPSESTLKIQVAALKYPLEWLNKNLPK